MKKNCKHKAVFYLMYKHYKKRKDYKNYMISALFIFMLCIVNTPVLKAQEVFSIGDLDPYLSKYVEPFARAMAISMNGGWTHTAKVHSTLGVDLSLSASYVKVPASDMSFNPQAIDMPGYSFIGTQAPTISSNQDTKLPLITKEFINGIPLGFTLPVLKGMNISYGGMVNLQAGIGLPKGTELIFRYIPDVSSSTNKEIDYDIELKKTGVWGLGLKHDFKQWIPYIKDLPYLQISAMLTYSRFFTGFSGDAMRVDPDMLGVDSDLPTNIWDNQKIDIRMSSFTGTLLLGADFPILQPFIGFGFNSSVFEGEMMGNYPIVKFNFLHPLGVVEDIEIDPFDTKVSAMNFNFQAGARLKLKFFVLYYTLTIQKYTMHTGGIAITIK